MSNLPEITTDNLGSEGDLSLREVPLRVDYRTDESHIIDEFYTPCMRESSSYWRAVGYFSSHSLVLAAKGLATMLHRGGTMRLVASPWLEPSDIDAIARGEMARDDVVERALLRAFDRRLMEEPSQLEQHRLQCLAWLIAEGKLEIKIASPTQTKGNNLYHEKIGIFMDTEGNTVAFTGSPNETAGGLVSNFESVDVFWSWDDPQGRIVRKATQFTRLWEDKTPGLEVRAFPQAVRDRILRFYRPDTPAHDIESQHKPSLLVPGDLSKGMPTIPAHLDLRDYQLGAIQSWFNNERRGMFVMATGSGKTITALSAVTRLVQQEQRCFVIISAPYQHLVDQWAEEAAAFGLKPVLAYQSTKRWSPGLGEDIVAYNLGVLPVVTVITTHTTLCTNVFQSLIAQVRGPAVFVADEAHHVGATDTRNYLPQAILWRIGLSATPNRWFDDEGTAVLERYFGRTIAEYPLARAIDDGRLTPYYYHPTLVSLTEDEQDMYSDLSRKIAVAYSRRDEEEQAARLDMLLRERAHLLNTAQNKLAALRRLVFGKSDLSHALFYCAPGQLDEVLALLGEELGFLVHPFTAQEKTTERQRLLKAFASGQLQALVAMRCLDEGVDVPATRVAYVLASSSNPREFIQRRGRILRRSPNKHTATIYDMLTMPEPREDEPGTFQVERNLVRRELSRFKEFASTALNHFKAYEVIQPIAQKYHLLDL